MLAVLENFSSKFFLASWAGIAPYREPVHRPGTVDRTPVSLRFCTVGCSSAKLSRFVLPLAIVLYIRMGRSPHRKTPSLLGTTLRPPSQGLFGALKRALSLAVGQTGLEPYNAWFEFTAIPMDGLI